MSAEYRAALRNAARQTVSALSAVEIDTDYGARQLIDSIITELGSRPHALLEMRSRSKEDAQSLFLKAKESCADWPAEQGVLFILDMPEENPSEQALEGRAAFWSVMNLQRENWGSLHCHVIFFLYTGAQGSFQLLLRVADHLASWVPLKFHLPEPRVRTETMSQAEIPAAFAGTMSPKVARDRLESLEKQLESDLAAGRANPQILVRRYYLPMLEATLSTGNLRRAQSLRARVTDKPNLPIQDSDLPRWWNAIFQLNMRLWRLDAAKETTETMLSRSDENTVMYARAMGWMGIIAQEKRDFDAAESWYRKAMNIFEELGDDHDAASTYHQLGIIAQKKRDFDAAESWYRKAMNIFEELGDDHDAAITYHQLGILAQERRDFDAAKSWHRKSLTIKEKQGDEHGAALTYHQLGRIAQEKRDFDAAKSWYRESLTIKENQGNEHSAALTYHQLGRIAQERRDFDAAKSWHRKSLTIKEKQGDEHGAALTYHQLGMIAQEKREFDAAENWYRKALDIKEKQGDEHSAVSTYHQLGMIAQERRDFDAAESWYKKALDIFEKLGDDHGTALTLSQLGLLNRAIGNFEQSGKSLLMGVEKFLASGDAPMAKTAMVEFLRTLEQTPADIQVKLRRLCREYGFGELMEQVEKASRDTE